MQFFSSNTQRGKCKKLLLQLPRCSVTCTVQRFVPRKPGEGGHWCARGFSFTKKYACSAPKRKKLALYVSEVVSLCTGGCELLESLQKVDWIVLRSGTSVNVAALRGKIAQDLSVCVLVEPPCSLGLPFCCACLSQVMRMSICWIRAVPTIVCTNGQRQEITTTASLIVR